jgi:hypothetical protein
MSLRHVFICLLFAGCTRPNAEHTEPAVADRAGAADMQTTTDMQSSGNLPSTDAAIACVSDGHIDGNDYNCCGIVPGALCPSSLDACPGTPFIWLPAALADSETYHQTAVATAAFVPHTKALSCSDVDVDAQESAAPSDDRQLVFHIVIPADAPPRTVLGLRPSNAAWVHEWYMVGSCGTTAPCVADTPSVLHEAVGTTLGALEPGDEIYFLFDTSTSTTYPTDAITLTLDLTNQ